MKKPTVVDLLQRILVVLEGKGVSIVIPAQPRIINERFTDNGDGTITDKENKTLIVKDPPKPNCCCGEIELKAGVQVVGNIAHCKTKPCYITTKPKPTCEHEWDFTGKWICIKCKKVRTNQMTMSIEECVEVLEDMCNVDLTEREFEALSLAIQILSRVNEEFIGYLLWKQKYLQSKTTYQEFKKALTYKATEINPLEYLGQCEMKEYCNKAQSFINSLVKED